MILGLALYFDAWWSKGRCPSDLLFDIRVTPERTKEAVFNHVKNEWDSGNVNIVKPGKFGTHSNRKRSYTRMRRCGICYDWADIRGRSKTWCVTDRYEDTLLPYPDAKACFALCEGGAIKYVVQNGFTITDAWLDQNVLPIMLKNVKLDRYVHMLLYLIYLLY